MSLQFQRSNGHPEPEVIVNVSDNTHLILRLNLQLQYADGYAYSKSKFEEGLRIVLAEKPPKPAKTQSGLKKDDIDLIVRRIERVGCASNPHYQQVSELEIPRAQAEKALLENGGDITKTLQVLITP
jgi:NACalpha-BTF3-like transcription factor